jgi:hypothetical protein
MPGYIDVRFPMITIASAQICTAVIARLPGVGVFLLESDILEGFSYS